MLKDKNVLKLLRVLICFWLQESIEYKSLYSAACAALRRGNRTNICWVSILVKLKTLSPFPFILTILYFFHLTKSLEDEGGYSLFFQGAHSVH